MWSLTMNRSTKRDNIGVTDIGRRSLTPPPGVHLGTGVIIAVRHADGTTPLCSGGRASLAADLGIVEVRFG